MSDKLSFHGSIDSRVLDNVLYIPRLFTPLDGNYALRKESIGPYKFLKIFPRQEATDEDDETPLEKLVLDRRTLGLKLPPSSLEHLGILKQKNFVAKL